MGVILLEIGLWKRAEDIVQQHRKERTERGGPSKEYSTQRIFLDKTGRRNKGSERHKVGKLEFTMGRAYQIVVQSCLKFEFEEAVDPDDQEGIIGEKLLKAFKEEVLDKLGHAEAGLAGAL